MQNRCKLCRVELVLGAHGGVLAVLASPTFPPPNSQPDSTLILTSEHLPQAVGLSQFEDSPSSSEFNLGYLPRTRAACLVGQSLRRLKQFLMTHNKNSMFCHLPTRKWTLFEEMEQRFRQLDISSGQGEEQEESWQEEFKAKITKKSWRQS